MKTMKNLIIASISREKPGEGGGKRNSFFLLFEFENTFRGSMQQQQQQEEGKEGMNDRFA